MQGGPETHPKRDIGLRKAVLFTALISLFGLALLDWVASYLTSPNLPISTRPSEHYFEFDPIQMWRLRPGFRDETIRISPQGFRSDEIVDVGSERKLAFLVGGSTVFGLGLRNDETLSYFLQQYADAAVGNGVYQVVNAGVTGYFSTQELILIERKLLAYRPALVISLTGRNDVFYSLHPAYRVDEVPYHGLIRRQLGALDPYYVEKEEGEPRLHLTRLLSRLLAGVAPDWDQEWEERDLVSDESSYDNFIQRQLAIHVLLSGLGTRHHLFLQPTLTFPERLLATGEPSSAEIPYLDPLNDGYRRLVEASERELAGDWFHGMLRLPEEEGALFLDDCHFTELGSRLAALNLGRTVFGDADVARIDFESDRYSVFLGGGWHDWESGFRWTGSRARARLRAPRSLSRGARFRLKGHAGGIRAHLVVSLNGRRVIEVELEANQPIDLDAEVPEEVLDGWITVEIETAGWTPRELGLNDDARLLGIQVSSLTLEEPAS